MTPFEELSGAYSKINKEKKMNLDDLTLGQLKEIKNMGNEVEKNCLWDIGKNYLIRTVTMIQTGKLVAISSQELKLENAAWIADTGRFNEALKDVNVFKEIEPFLNPILVGRGSVIDATEIKKLPLEVK